MQLIESKTLGSAQASIEFTNIPQTPFTDLLVLFSWRSASDVDYIALTYNGSSSNFSSRDLKGAGTSVFSETRSDNLFTFTVVKSTFTANTFTNGQLYIPNYAGSTNKSFSIEASNENNGTDGRNTMIAGLWSNTAAISSMAFASGGGTNFVSGSMVSLYGITKGSDGTTTVS